MGKTIAIIIVIIAGIILLNYFLKWNAAKTYEAKTKPPVDIFGVDIEPNTKQDLDTYQDITSLT